MVKHNNKVHFTGNSRFGQKGVVGKIADSWDLPFCKDGTVPDLIMNPLALPSRMTIPTILESMFGLVACSTNETFSLVTFDPVQNMRERLAELGLDATQVMINSKTGKDMVPITIGPQYFQRLGHFASHKCYAREKGQNAKLTRQPTDGRSRAGGLRVGEMETDALHGTRLAHTLEDRLFYNSDKFFVHICRDCKGVALNQDLCLCKAKTDRISMVKQSFTTNLIFNQKRALGVKLEFGLAKEVDETVEPLDSCSESDDSSSCSESVPESEEENSIDVDDQDFEAF